MYKRSISHCGKYTKHNDNQGQQNQHALKAGADFQLLCQLRL